MKFFRPLLHFLFHIGYFGPLLMGVLDSSFLVLPFGNDLVVVGLVAGHHHGAVWYVLAAACGSCLGVLILALVCRKLGEEGIRKVAGDKKYDSLKNRIGKNSGIAIFLGGIAPPPFPFTMVIGAAAALDYSLWRIVVINFLARGARFAILAWLAIKFGQAVIAISKSPAFEWTMGVFIFLCVAASAFSLWKWFFRRDRGSQQKDKKDKKDKN